MFGVPDVFCGDTAEHLWHGDGTRHCPGVPGEVFWVETFDQLDSLAREYDVEGHTYWTGTTRRAYVYVHGILHTSPGVRTTSGTWLNPGGHTRHTTAEHEADYAANRWEQRIDRSNGS